MIIPIRCFTCNKVLGNLWNAYEKEAKKIDDEHHQKFLAQFDKDEKKNEEDKEKKYANISSAYKGKLLDELGCVRLCCRRHMLTHVHMMNII